MTHALHQEILNDIYETHESLRRAASCRKYARPHLDEEDDDLLERRFERWADRDYRRYI